ncbi:cyclic peptide export ABC transporter [Flavobacteriaceae bacterium M23B6Z8]
MENIANIIYLACTVLAFLGTLYLGFVVYQKIKGKRSFAFTLKNLLNYLVGFVVLAPLVLCLYYTPMAFYDENFWMTQNTQYDSAKKALWFLGIFGYCFYALVRFPIFLPHEKERHNIIPQLSFLSLIPGVSSALNVMIISEFMTEDVSAAYLLILFGVNTFMYIITSRVSRRQAAKLAIIFAHKVNMNIIRGMFKIPFQKYEKINQGKIYTILNNDVNAIYYFTQDFLSIYTATITIILIMVYMYSLNLVSSLILLAVTLIVLGLHVLTSKPLKRRTHIERNEREKYSGLISSSINGFKELILHNIKVSRFQDDMEEASKNSYEASKQRSFVAIDFGLFSELAFTIAIGVSCLVFPLVFNFGKEVTTAYVLAVLFLAGPVTVLINRVPLFINAQVSWKRIKDFVQNTLKDPEVVDQENPEQLSLMPIVNRIQVQDVCFKYENEKGETVSYGIGPINFEANKGELIFVIGGNGSGKTTFLKILTGLYAPSSGRILINGKEVNNKELGEYFSVIFSDFYLFKKIYDIKEDRLGQVYEWLEVLQLSEKVKIEDGIFSTINLSKGQRKRLAILKSYLEDRPVYFFDEVAADLDPEFRDFFYNNLLVTMRKEGKILIIISHDDKYFSLADHIYKMDMGTISVLEKEFLSLSEHY